MDIELHSRNVDNCTITKDCEDQQPDCSNQNLTLSEQIKSFFVGRLKATSIPLIILLVWLLFESLVCVIVLNGPMMNFSANFLNYICKKGDEYLCPSLLGDLLQFRILVSSVSIIGIMLGYSSVASIWLVMNALGLCPLLPVVFSCYHKYADLDSTIDNASFVWLIIKGVYTFIMPVAV